MSNWVMMEQDFLDPESEESEADVPEELRFMSRIDQLLERAEYIREKLEEEYDEGTD